MSIRFTTFKFSISNDISPRREFEDKYKSKRSFNFQSVEGIPEVNPFELTLSVLRRVRFPKQAGNDPESLFPLKNK